jgi:hypothetical protein
MIPITITEADLMARIAARNNGTLDEWKPSSTVAEPPKAFDDWVEKNKERIVEAGKRGTLPYWVRDNGKYFVPSRGNTTMTNTANKQRILANKQEYTRLKADPNYTDVKFDGKTGGLLAIHKDHNFDPTIGKFGIPRGDYEHIAAEVLYKNGKSVVFASEKSISGQKTPEGILEGKIFDIKGVEGVGKRNIEYKLFEASRQGVETVVLYYYDKNIFDKQCILNSYNSYLRNSKSKRVKTVYYIVEKKLYQLQQNSL